MNMKRVVPVTKTVDIGKGYRIIEIDAPSFFWEKSLKGLNLGALCQIDVLLIKRKNPPQTIILLSADEIIRKRDTLILAGHADSLNKIINNKA